MTWILGCGVPFGYGALISDVRAIWPDGRKLDRLQKIYPVAPGLIAGFAGSVAVGFSMIARMQRRLAAPPGTLYPVKHAAWHWARYARRFYTDGIKPEFKRLGCELILAGVSPERDGPYLRSWAVRMTAPAFAIEVVPQLTWGSIGTGRNHRAAVDYANRDRFWDRWMQFEIVNPGGAAFAIAHSVALDLEKDPLESVSPVLLIGMAAVTDHQLHALRRERRGAWSVAKGDDLKPGELLTNWSDFKRAAAEANLEAGAAVT
jgi:hypothetical protein